MTAPSGEADDDLLLARLGQLALVDLAALLAGTEGPRRSALRAAHDEVVAHALGQVAARAAALLAELARPEPQGPGRGARLRARARAARALARLDEAAAALAPATTVVGRGR